MLDSLTYFLFFFFQAEDGIRDYKVTGVQTCALPISAMMRMRGGFTVTPSLRGAKRRGNPVRPGLLRFARNDGERDQLGPLRTCEGGRSEERRVGKECRSRGSRYQ